MKLVIQCAATKNPTGPNAGFKSADNRSMRFVANPQLAPLSATHAFAHPDDVASDGETWRQRLLRYNLEAPDNPQGLLPASKLYSNPAYESLVRKFGPEQIFILSAGWGLIPSTFLTPDYDITFSGAPNVAPHCRRKKGDAYADSCLLQDDGEPISFLGGKDYLPLFCKLTAPLRATKKVFFNSSVAPTLGSGFTTERFPTSRRTNWHYGCADDIVAERVRA